MPLVYDNTLPIELYIESLYEKHLSNQSGISNISGSVSHYGYSSNIPGSENFPLIAATITNQTGVSNRQYIDTFNNTNTFGSSLRFRRLRGTPDNVSGILQNDTMAHIAAEGATGAGITTTPAAVMLFAAAEDWGTGHNGTYFRLRLTPSGSNVITDRLWIKDNGNVGISNTNPQYTLDISGAANFTQGVYIGGSNILSLVSGGEVQSNSEIYRNINNQITGIKYDNDFSRIYRNNNNKITGIYFNTYFKRVLYDNTDKVTGVNVIYY